MKKKTKEIGETVTTFVMTSTGKKLKANGKVKSRKVVFGRMTYVITDAKVIEDFKTRTVK